MNEIDQFEPIEPLEPLYEMLELLIARYGSWGIAAAMFAESAGLPFASAVVLLTAGTLILRGSLSFWSVFIASTIGITLGSIFSYIVGLLGSMAGTAVKSGFFHHPGALENETAGKSDSKIIYLFKKYGNFSVFMAQLWGITRTFGSFPAGAMHMNLFVFILYTFLGGAFFSLIYVIASIALVRAMSLVYYSLKYIADLSPWLLSIPIALTVAAAYYYFFYRHSKSLPINFRKPSDKE